MNRPKVKPYFLNRPKVKPYFRPADSTRKSVLSYVAQATRFSADAARNCPSE
jgi:hypothetical protein